MATTTITTTAGEDARLVVAFGKYLGLPGNATQPQIVAELRRYMTAIVAAQEQQAAVAALAPITPIAPT